MSGSNRARSSASSFCERLPGVRFDGVHQSVGQVAVVWNSQHIRAGFLLELCQRLPQIFRILGVELRVRHRLVGDRRVAAEEHVAVQIEAAPGRCTRSR